VFTTASPSVGALHERAHRVETIAQPRLVVEKRQLAWRGAGPPNGALAQRRVERREARGRDGVERHVVEVRLVDQVAQALLVVQKREPRQLRLAAGGIAARVEAGRRVQRAARDVDAGQVVRDAAIEFGRRSVEHPPVGNHDDGRPRLAQAAHEPHEPFEAGEREILAAPIDEHVRQRAPPGAVVDQALVALRIVLEAGVVGALLRIAPVRVAIGPSPPRPHELLVDRLRLALQDDVRWPQVRRQESEQIVRREQAVEHVDERIARAAGALDRDVVAVQEEREDAILRIGRELERLALIGGIPALDFGRGLDPDEFHRLDLLCFAVFENLEILRPEIRDDPAVALRVHVHGDEVGPGAKGRTLLGRRGGRVLRSPGGPDR
jgi:hypothetical protein